MIKNKKADEKSNDAKVDLKHDTMEYAEPLNGEYESESDDAILVDDDNDEITSKELNMLGQDQTDNQAYALNSAEEDKINDEDNLPEEDWTEDTKDE